MEETTFMAVYYPLFAEPFDITQEPPLHTAIIAALVASYQDTLTTPETLNSTPKSLPATLDEILRQQLRTDRNIAETKRTKVGIVYQDLIARANNVSCLRDYLTHLLTGHFPTKTECASAMGTGKSNLSRNIPYNKVINWLADIGYRVGHIESLYNHPKARQSPREPIVDEHIRDLTTRELQLIKIGSTLGSLAASTPATSLSDSMLKIKDMALTCADLLSKVIPIPDEPLDYHNNFFHIVNDIVNASCQVSLPNPANPDCRKLLKSEDPVPEISKDRNKECKIDSIFEKWPLITSRHLIEREHRMLLAAKLKEMGCQTHQPGHAPDAKKSLVSNQHSMISRALAELQYLAVFLRISDGTLINKAITDMETQIAKMVDHAPTKDDLFIIEDLGFHEVIPRLVANYSHGQFNPMNLERFVQILHDSAFNRTRSRLSTPEERMAIVQDHKKILAALKLYHSDEPKSAKSAERKARVVDCLSRHLYLALNTETTTDDHISSVARDSVSDAIKLFGLTARSFTHQATSIWTEQGAKRMLFVSDYQLPREMLGGEESDHLKQDVNILRFISALHKLHKIRTQEDPQSCEPFIFIFCREKEELHRLFPTNSRLYTNAVSYYKRNHRILSCNVFDLSTGLENAKAHYLNLIKNFSRSKYASAEALLSEADEDNLMELKNDLQMFAALLDRIRLCDQRSHIGPYHSRGGAVAWIQGRFDEIFRTSRLSESGAIVQDIWGGDEYLLEIADICTSIQVVERQASKLSSINRNRSKPQRTGGSPAMDFGSKAGPSLAATIILSFSLQTSMADDVAEYVSCCGHNGQIVGLHS
jgi:hypothetical protein